MVQGQLVEVKCSKRKSSNAEGGTKKKASRPSVGSILVQLALSGGISLFHTPDGTAYAKVPGVSDGSTHLETHKVCSRSFKSWLRCLYFKETKGTIPPSQAIADAVATIEGIAVHARPVDQVNLRVAQAHGYHYIDLVDPQWRAVKIDGGGWEVSDLPAVHFRRQRAMLPLPEPKRGGSLDQLRSFLNVANDEDWRLAVVWLLAAMRPTGPYPLLVLNGQQGSAKSTTARVLRSLVDPNAAPIRCEPKDARDLMIAANAGHVIALDNLSGVPSWLSDALCRLSTGGGFSTRQLYSDDEEIIFDAQRPLVLTSIGDVCTRGDLLERSLILSLPPIPERERRPESEFWDRFERERPYIFAALLDVMAGALRELSAVKLATMPRMADFAVWATACERALGWPAGSFLAAYGSNRSAANEVALESSPIVTPLKQILAHTTEWSGNAAELLDTLRGHVSDQTAHGKYWPKRANLLAGALRRLAPNLREIGISVEFRRGHSHKIIDIKREKFRDSSTPSDASTQYRENKAFSSVDGSTRDRRGDNEDRRGDNGRVDASDGRVDGASMPDAQKPLENKRCVDGVDGVDESRNFSARDDDFMPL